MIKELEYWEDIFSDNIEDFIKEVIGIDDIIDAYQVSWSSSNMFYTYILDCGQHVCSEITMEEWLKLKDKYERNSN